MPYSSSSRSGLSLEEEDTGWKCSNECNGQRIKGTKSNGFHRMKSVGSSSAAESQLLALFNRVLRWSLVKYWNLFSCFASP